MASDCPTAAGEWTTRTSPAARAGFPTGHPSGVESRPARSTRRIPHRVPCRVKLYDPTSGQPAALVGQTINLSDTGLAVQLSRSVLIGTWVEALVPHFNGDPIFVCGTVAHSRRVLAGEYEIGIRFAHDAPPNVF